MLSNQVADLEQRQRNTAAAEANKRAAEKKCERLAERLTKLEKDVVEERALNVSLRANQGNIYIGRGNYIWGCL